MFGAAADILGEPAQAGEPVLNGLDPPLTERGPARGNPFTDGRLRPAHTISSRGEVTSAQIGRSSTSSYCNSQRSEQAILMYLYQ